MGQGRGHVSLLPLVPFSSQTVMNAYKIKWFSFVGIFCLVLERGFGVFAVGCYFFLTVSQGKQGAHRHCLQCVFGDQKGSWCREMAGVIFMW